ncbi:MULTISPECIES: fasciclin domain-containing protein [Rhodomicrobium]|uniref:fasciclin domain-containing protein n=1 Tax=Rhodomicrobium TaxID=1068 RepID=UPI000B4C1A39|nr:MULTISPECIES: fasciclin domain-containing protein [Rhodomicrobium]
MLKSAKTLVAIAAIGAAAFGAATSLSAAQPETTVMVGGAPMFPSKTIVDNAVNSKDHTTLVAAVKAAGLVDTLKGPGPFTVFAPVNAAFDKLPAGTVPTLLKPENKKTLAGVLTYHVVSGRFTADELMAKAGAMGGSFTLKTVQGGTLTIEKTSDTQLSVIDAKGGKASITISNVLQSNGVIHVIDGVLLPS